MSYSLNAPRKFPLEDFWKIKIVPPSAGVDALVVRDYADTVSRIKIMEGDKGIWGYDAAGTWMFRLMPYNAYDAIAFNTGVDFRGSMLLSGPYFTLANGKSIRTEGTATSSFLLRSHDGAAYVDCAKLVGGYLEIARGLLKNDIPFYGEKADGTIFELLKVAPDNEVRLGATWSVKFIIDGLAIGAVRSSPLRGFLANFGFATGWGTFRPRIEMVADRSTENYLRIISFEANSVDTLRDSPPLAMRGAYWNGAASVDRDATIKHVLLSTTPTSEIVFQIAGIDYFKIGDAGVWTLKDINLDSRKLLNVTKITSPSGSHLTLDPATGYVCAEHIRGRTDNAYNLGTDSYRWRNILFGTACKADSNPADATNVVVNSPPFILQGAYWDGSASVDRAAKIVHELLSATPESAIDFEIAGTLCARIKDNGALAIKKVDIGDYGGNFATYSPPTGEEGMIVIAVDTNATAPGQRLYVYCNGSWRYANLT